MTQEGGFTALVLDEADGKVTLSIKTLDDDALPEGNVVVSVAYSDLNYKDGLVLGGARPAGPRLPAYPRDRLFRHR